jgi:hypothetical protein
MLCDFQITEESPGLWRHECRREGCRVVRVIPHPRLVRQCDVVGLGDAVAWVLNRAGIRVRNKCDCKRRRAMLNQAGEAIVKGVRSLVGY